MATYVQTKRIHQNLSFDIIQRYYLSTSNRSLICFFCFPSGPAPFQTISCPRRKSRLSNLLHQEFNHLVSTSRTMQIMRDHNQLDVWQQSLCNLPDLLFLVFEQFARADLAKVSLSSEIMGYSLTRTCGAMIRDVKTGLTSLIAGRNEHQLVLKMRGSKVYLRSWPRAQDCSLSRRPSKD